MVLRQTKRPAEAEAAFREAIRLNPGFAPAHLNLGLVLNLDANRYTEAEAAFREVIRLNPALARPRNNLDKLLNTRK